MATFTLNRAPITTYNMASSDQARTSGLRTRVSVQVSATRTSVVTTMAKISEVSRVIQPLGWPAAPK